MKGFVCLIMSACLLLSGCNAFGERISEPVSFYYVRSEYSYGATQESVMAPEQREAAGHRDSLHYLMVMYFLGPVEEDLLSPLPHGTSLMSVRHTEEEIHMELSDTSLTLTDMGYTLACACLTMTCLEITDAQSVTIISGPRSLTLTRDNLTLFDSHTGAAAEDTQ